MKVRDVITSPAIVVGPSAMYGDTSRPGDQWPYRTSAAGAETNKEQRSVAVRFINRVDAGRKLAVLLEPWGRQSPLVLGLPRGGVPVAAEVARVLRAPLDVIMVRKLGVPYQPELAMGAIGEAGVRVLNDEVIRLTGVTEQQVRAVESQERVELERRAHRYRGDRSREPLNDRIVIIVDDGVATGSTARAACQVARSQGAARVILATPVAPAAWIDRLGDAADDYVAVSTPDPFFAVGQFYMDFSPTSDAQVTSCLDSALAVHASVAAGPEPLPDPPVRDDEVEVQCGHTRLRGHLVVPEEAVGLVIFAHGSGSSRHSPRNRFVAKILNESRLATLLFDLLTPEEECDRANVFDVGLLGARLTDVPRWAVAQPDLSTLPVGYFGASTGAAAALWASVSPDIGVRAVVSRGGRPDLASARLDAVTAPSLFIVGSRDSLVLDLNRSAATLMRCETEVVVVPGATHLFDEPGTLEIAANAARDWFTHHLSPVPHAAAPARSNSSSA